MEAVEDTPAETIEQIQAEINAAIVQPPPPPIPQEDVVEVQQQTTEIPQQQQIPVENKGVIVAPTTSTPKLIEVFDDDEEEEEDDDDDDDDYDDDEEKDNSQKLVMDLDEDDEDEDDDDDEVEELEKDEAERSDNVVAAVTAEPSLEKPLEQVKTTGEKEVTSTAKSVDVKPTENAEAIITLLSDAEEETTVAESTTKPGKVQKRKSVGATTSNEEERYRLKRRKINAEGAPKMPLTGYVRYMNDRREAVRKDHPTKNSIEVTKVIAEEWQALSSDVKGEYLKAAEVDKQRYLKELHTFLKSRPDILASELAKNKIRKTDSNNPNAATSSTKQATKDKAQSGDSAKSSKDVAKEKATPKEKEAQPIATTSSLNSEKQQNIDKSKRKRTPTPPFNNATSSATAAAAAGAAATSSASATAAAGPSTSAAASNSSSAPNAAAAPTSGEIPIFTTEFLEHNKIYDMELRSLRKSKTDLEQQNFVLEKHVENMKCGVEKMQSENNELQEKNRLLEIYLDKLKRKLATALGTLPLPSAPNGATVDNIDKYMQDLYKMSSSNSHGPATLNKAKDIIRKLDLQIQL